MSILKHDFKRNLIFTALALSFCNGLETSVHMSFVELHVQKDCAAECSLKAGRRAVDLELNYSEFLGFSLLQASTQGNRDLNLQHV